MLSMTSPIGVVPQELELTYPAQHYDSVVTGRWSANEIEFVSDVLERYLERNDYPEVVVHVPGEGYRGSASAWRSRSMPSSPTPPSTTRRRASRCPIWPTRWTATRST